VKQEADLRNTRSFKKTIGIPHLQLFGQLSELKEYKVKNILAQKIILARNVLSNKFVIFKTLHKSPAVYKKSKTSLLPINIIYMVKLLKYFETDDCVYLMLEYCSSGKMWDIVRPLVEQKQLRDCEVNDKVPCVQDSQERNRTPVQKQTSIIKPSPSFIYDRKISIGAAENIENQVCDLDLSDDSNEDFDDINLVEANGDSVVIFNKDCIQHFEVEKDEGIHFKDQDPLVHNSQKMLENISKTLNKNDTDAKNVLDKLDDIEHRIKQHLEGNISPDTVEKESIEEIDVRLSNEGNNTLSNIKTEDQNASKRRPRVLRKLSEVLPQCSDEYFMDSTELPDKLIRTWAAEIAQVLSSLHYREVVIRDLNPTNILLDDTGHVKLTYQCEWVSVDSSLSQSAIEENFCAPEVISVGDITPAADWWSYGAILHLMYCGTSPSSVIATGVDSSIPIDFPPRIGNEVKDFIQQLLQVQPCNRLGAGTCGSNDIRLHPYFSDWDWNRMSWK